MLQCGLQTILHFFNILALSENIARAKISDKSQFVRFHFLGWGTANCHPTVSKMKLFVPSLLSAPEHEWHMSCWHCSQTLTIMVLEFPPRESCSRRVSFEFLYGTCVLLPSTRAEMTFPNVERERLILVASFRRWPVAPVFPCLSDPWTVGRWRN